MWIQDAREKRGWTVYAAAERMLGVSHQSLRNLEASPALGDECKVRTMLEIIRVYWPDVTLADFLTRPECSFKLIPADKKARRQLNYGSSAATG